MTPQQRLYLLMIQMVPIATPTPRKARPTFSIFVRPFLKSNEQANTGRGNNNQHSNNSNNNKHNNSDDVNSNNNNNNLSTPSKRC